LEHHRTSTIAFCRREWSFDIFFSLDDTCTKYIPESVIGLYWIRGLGYSLLAREVGNHRAKQLLHNSALDGSTARINHNGGMLLRWVREGEAV